MKTERWIRITSCENIPLREGRAVQVGGHEIAVFNLGDRFLAIDGRCPHKGGPLADGIVSGATVVCPLHAWNVDLECGRVTKPADAAACQRTYRTRVEEGVVLLETSALREPVIETSVEDEVSCTPTVVAEMRSALEPTSRV